MITITINKRICSESQAIQSLTRVGYESDAAAFVKSLPHSLTFRVASQFYKLFRHWRATGEVVTSIAPKTPKRRSKGTRPPKPAPIVAKIRPVRQLTRQEARLLNPGDKVLTKSGIPMTYLRREGGYYWCQRPNKSMDFKANLYTAS